MKNELMTGQAVTDPFLTPELLNRQPRSTLADLANVIFEYIEDFCNRRHGAFGWDTPTEFDNSDRQRATTPQLLFRETGS